MQEKSRPRDCIMEVTKDLTCPICLEFFSHPIILPCSHVMCRQPCAENVFEGNFIRCPVCRDNCYVSGGFSSLPRVITLESIIEKIRADRKKKVAARHAQRKEATSCHHDGSPLSEMTSESWLHKANSDELFSDMGSDRISPDIFRCGSTPTMTNDPTSASDRLSREAISIVCPSPAPSFAISSQSNSSSPTATPTPSSRHWSARSLPCLNGLSGNPSHTAASSAESFIRTSGPFQSSLVPSMSSFPHLRSYLSRHEHINTPMVIPESDRYNHLRHDNNNNQGQSSSIPTSLMAQSTPRQILPLCSNQCENNITNISRSSSGDNNNVQRTLEMSDRCDRSLEDTDSSFRNGSNTSSINPVHAICTGDSVLHRSTRYNSTANICHERSIANLQECSNSIAGLQNEYMSLAREIQIQTPREYHALSMQGPDFTPILHSAPHQQSSARFEESLLPTFNPGSSLHHGVNGQLAANVDGCTPTNPTVAAIRRDRSPQRNNQQTSSITGEVDNSQTSSHETLSSDTPADESAILNNLKRLLQSQLEKLCSAQCLLVGHMTSYSSHAQRDKSLLDRERAEVNKECDSLVAEIENKRAHFLLHLEEEGKHESLNLSDVTVAMETLLESTHHLIQFVGQVLESRPDVLLNTASNVFDRLSRAVQECESCLQESASTVCQMDHSLFGLNTARMTQQHVDGQGHSEEDLDLPNRPEIDTQRCVRNTHTVALVLAPPSSSDIIDHYEVSYCSEEQKNLGIEERYYAKQSPEVDVYDVVTETSHQPFDVSDTPPRPKIDATSHGSFPVILIENLCASTHYYFSLCAVNRKGRSQFSDYVQCQTLGQQDCVVPVPTILEKLSHVTSTSVQIACPSLATVTSHQEVDHFLLVSAEHGAVVWKGRQLLARHEDFVVGQLRPGSRYFFRVMACNRRGEGQVSSLSLFDTVSVA